MTLRVHLVPQGIFDLRRCQRLARIAGQRRLRKRRRDLRSPRERQHSRRRGGRVHRRHRGGWDCGAVASSCERRHHNRADDSAYAVRPFISTGHFRPAIRVRVVIAASAALDAVVQGSTFPILLSPRKEPASTVAVSRTPTLTLQYRSSAPPAGVTLATAGKPWMPGNTLHTSATGCTFAYKPLSPCRGSVSSVTAIFAPVPRADVQKQVGPIPAMSSRSWVT
ncbi:hypothetical protein HUW46_09359 [Amycolatopsis sp. CA-230715]|nr:hypothetical protein HUW46_09359 [Amycolatopsis sp. CA-230715]